MQNARTVLYVVSPSTARLVLPSFSTLSHIRHDFRAKRSDLFIFSTILSEINRTVRRIQRDTITTVHLSSRKLRLFLSDMKLSLKFLDRFLKNPQTSHFMKIYPVGVEFFHADGQTGGYDETRGRFSQFCKKKQYLLRISIRVQNGTRKLVKQLVLVFFIQTN
jgi:hypothetical protein